MYSSYICRWAQWLPIFAVMTALPVDTLRKDRFRAAVQFCYLMAFFVWAVWPNVVNRQSVVIVIVLTLALIWLLGTIGTWFRFGHADELMLCGSVGPLLMGLVQFGYRLQFIWSHGALAPSSPDPGNASAFAMVWAYEFAVILVPGLLFTVWNARSMRPLPPIKTM